KKGEASSSSIPSMPIRVWQPGVDKLEEGEELQCDPSAYNSLHGFHVGWPFLTFLGDKLGLSRTEFPHTLYMVAGTQAEKAPWNSIGLFKISSLSGKRRDVVPKNLVNGDDGMEDEDDEGEDSDSDEESEDGASSAPNIQVRRVAHHGCVNRIRAMPQNPHICVSSADSAHVQPASGSWTVDPIPLAGHTASEANVFASCSVDGIVALWDIRMGKSPGLSFMAHNEDVNVISWNRLASCMLASGSDDGTFSIHDLRVIKDKDKAKVAHFGYHKHPITSIEWSAHESSTLAVSSGDNQLTIWDLSLKMDEEEFKAQSKEQVNTPQDLPPQLLFVHQGQKDLKELHWHNQIPGMIVSTAADGFNILMPYKIQNTLPDLAA
ncbi:unnamed protein product, partial [Brassica rapa]